MSAVLIRAWDVRHNPVGYAQAEFEDGQFTLPEADPLVKVARQDMFLISFVTVLDTEELMWRLISIHRDLSTERFRFECRPWITELRRSLRSDQWFVENVIETGAGL